MTQKTYLRGILWEGERKEGFKGGEKAYILEISLDIFSPRGETILDPNFYLK